MRNWLTFLISLVLVQGLVSVASADLVAYYTFDEAGTDAIDASGNGFDGVYEGVPDFVDGHSNGAVEFFGTEWVLLPAEFMGINSGLGSVSMWIKCPEISSAIFTLFWGGDNNTGGGFGSENEMHVHLEGVASGTWDGGEISFTNYGGARLFFLFSDPEKGTDPSATPVNPLLGADDEWHHIVAVWDSIMAVAQLYVDGNLLGEAMYEYTGTIYDFTYIFLGSMGNNSRAYSGILDDVLIYNHALSYEDVQNLYSGTPVEDKPVAESKTFALNQNYPNPFNPTTEIAFSIPERMQVNLEIYNAQGQLVETMVNGQLSAGAHSYTFNAENLPSGVYYYKLQSGNDVQTRKMILMK